MNIARFPSPPWCFRRAAMLLSVSCAAANFLPAQTFQPLGPTGGGDVRSLAGRCFAFGHGLPGNDGRRRIRLTRCGRPLGAARTNRRRSYGCSECATGGRARRLDVIRDHLDAGARWRERRGLREPRRGTLIPVCRTNGTCVASAGAGAIRSKRAGGRRARRRVSTRDHAITWKRITPDDYAELRNVDSLAFDPADAATIYAGTFHLPWKTKDAGEHWLAIHDGMIDDSDVLSLAVDAEKPERYYASACSGIYSSDSGGARGKRSRASRTLRGGRTRCGRIVTHPSKLLRRHERRILDFRNDGGDSWNRTTAPTCDRRDRDCHRARGRSRRREATSQGSSSDRETRHPR